VVQQLICVSVVWCKWECANSNHIQLFTFVSEQTSPQVVSYIRSYTSILSASCLSSGTCAWNLPSFSGSTQNISSLADDSSKVNALYYLSIYALIGMVYLIISLSRELLLFWGSLSASWKLHKRLLEAVTRAKFRFFDSTPLG